MRRSAAIAHPARRGAAVLELRQEIRGLLRRTREVLRSAEPSVDLELDPPALEVLAHVVAERRAYPADIAQRLGMDDNVVGRAACELQQLGLLVPIADVSNPANMALVPTAMGRRIHGEGADAASDALDVMLSGWSLDEVQTLTRLLARLNRPDPT